MSQVNPPGYPLPDGDLGSDELVCQLVYLPDKPEYWQALYGALSYMATWRAWERDTDKRGKDAAGDWRLALELTTECWRMTCLDDIETTLDSILAIMELPAECCGPVDVTDGDQYTDRVVDGVGDVPQNVIDAGYASGVSDWAGFDDYKCMIAHVTVDTLAAKILELAPLVNSVGAIAGGVTTLAAFLAVIFATGGLALVVGIFVSAGAAALLYENLPGGALLVTLAAKVVTNSDDLACAIYQSDGDVQSLERLNDKIDELFTTVEAIVLKSMNLGPTLKMLYAGRYDQQDIAEILFDAGYELTDFDCEDCDIVTDELVIYDFNSGLPGNWNKLGGTITNLDDTLYHYGTTHPEVLEVRKTFGQINTDFSLSWSNAYLRKITFDYMFYDVLGGWVHHVNNFMQMKGQAEGEATEVLWTQTFNGTPVQNTWYTVSLEGSELGELETKVLDLNNFAIMFRSYAFDVHSPSIGFKWDNIKLYLDEAA